MPKHVCITQEEIANYVLAENTELIPKVKGCAKCTALMKKVALSAVVSVNRVEIQLKAREVGIKSE